MAPTHSDSYTVHFKVNLMYKWSEIDEIMS